jgi:hypothetical protein
VYVSLLEVCVVQHLEGGGWRHIQAVHLSVCVCGWGGGTQQQQRQQQQHRQVTVGAWSVMQQSTDANHRMGASCTSWDAQLRCGKKHWICQLLPPVGMGSGTALASCYSCECAKASRVPCLPPAILSLKQKQHYILECIQS